MKALFNNECIETRSDLTLELLPGELMELRPAPVALELLDAPGGMSPTLTDGGVVLHEPGRYHFRVEHPDGARTDLRLVCFEPELLAIVQHQTRSLGHGGAEVDARKVRSVVRSLCTAHWFDGSVACVTTGDPSRALSHFGC